MTVSNAVCISCSDQDWAIGERYKEALRSEGFLVVSRPIPGSVRAFLNQIKGRELARLTPSDCRALVVIHSPSWYSALPPEPNFTEFRRLAETDLSRLTIVVHTTREPGPAQISNSISVDAVKLRFSGSVAAVIRNLTDSQQSLVPESQASSAQASPDPHISVFVSYAHEDCDAEKLITDELSTANFDVWVDRLSIPHDADWERAIRGAIPNQDAFVFLASEAAVESPIVSQELDIARGNNRPIFGIWVRGTRWYDCVPMGYYRRNYIDARGDKFAGGVQQLIAELRHRKKES